MNGNPAVTEHSVALPPMRHDAGIEKTVMGYFIMTKPAVWGSLTITAAIGYMIGSFIAYQFSIVQLFIVVAALAAGTSGCESLTNFIDTPVDRLMKRTAARPLPSGEIPGENAVVLGIVLVIAAMTLSSFLGVLFIILMGFGIFDNVIVYSFLLKRRTSQNILWGGFSGAIPVTYGFLASASSYILMASLLFLFVFAWTPPHIWGLSIWLKDDYRNAGIPMLPVSASKKVWGSGIALFSVFTVVITLFIAIAMGYLNVLIPLVILDAVLVYALLKLLMKPERYARKFFVYTNVYLFLALMLFMIGAMTLNW